MKELVIAFGLFLFIEGALYAIFPSKMKDDYVDFMDYQNWRYEECFKIVNLSNDQFQVKVPKTRPWELIGVLPQKMRDHDHVTAQSYNQLIKLEDLK